MKKYFVLALSALMVAAFAVPSMAKVNLSGALWVTYWAQQQAGDVNTLAANPGANVWVDSNLKLAPAAMKKTFIVGQSMSGNGLQGNATAGDGFLLALDCPVNDWVKAYGEVDVLNAGNLVLQQGYINLAFMKEVNVRAGLQNVPFGYEPTTRPTVGQEEVFISDYTQQARGALQRRQDVGVQMYGALANNMVNYQLFMGNGVIPTVADSAAMVAGSNVTPDNNDAKQIGVNLCFKPFTGAFIGGSYFGGDFTNTNLTSADGRSKFTAYDLNAGYAYGNLFSVSAEYATTRHDKLASAFQLGTSATQPGLVQNRVNEYLFKAIYTGIADWEFGARYSMVDPKNQEAEILAGFSYERKVSVAAAYKFARAATLKAEYSWVNSNQDYTGEYSAAKQAAGAAIINPNAEPSDDIFALSLGLQF